MFFNQRVAIIIPAKNEENTIGPLIHSISKNLSGAFICVIINHSTDNTYRNCLQAIDETGIAQNRFLIKAIDKPGKTHAVKVALQLVHADYYVLMDADAQHHPQELTKMLNLLNDQQADMVIGSRFMNHPESPNFRYWLNKMMNHWVNYSFKINLTDALSGYRIFSADYTKNLSLKSVNFELEMELFFHALKNNHTIIEYPKKTNSRLDNRESKLNLFIDGLHILKFSIINGFKLKHAK